MDVATITMDPDEARERLEAYRTALRRRSDVEYESVAAAYGALAKGTPLIDVPAAIRDAPTDDRGRPMLAIAAADRRQVRMYWRQGENNAWFLSTAYMSGWGVGRWPRLELRIDMRREHGYERTWPDGSTGSWEIQGYALVPMVPAGIRRSGQLRDFFILWEVEEWADDRIGAQPDRDPYLLRHLHGDLRGRGGVGPDRCGAGGDARSGAGLMSSSRVERGATPCG